MFKAILINMLRRKFADVDLKKLLPEILCSLFGLCLEHNDCPDGDCEKLMVAAQELADVIPAKVEPGALMAPKTGLCLDAWPEFVETWTAALAATKRLFANTCDDQINVG